MSVPGNAGWRNFWKTDCPASCVADNPATAREIADAWQRWLADLPDGSRILDIATGNGIVLAHAAAAARAQGRQFRLTGTDLADIDPLRYVSGLREALGEAHEDARFTGGIAAEKLPFADTSFDVVTSQYGLEYSDLKRALPEVTRVLAAGGRLLWLAHSEISDVVKQHRDQAQEVDFLLAPRGPLYCMQKFVARQRRHKDMEYSVQMLNDSLLQAYAYCRAHPPASLMRELCSGYADVANRWQSYGPDKLKRIVDESERRLLAHRDRIQSLLGAVLTPARIATIRARIGEPAWLDLALTEVRVGAGETPIGSRITARRAAQ